MTEPTSAPNPDATATPPAQAANQPPAFPNKLAAEVQGDWNKVEQMRHEQNRYITELRAQINALQEQRVNPAELAAQRQSHVDAIATELAVEPSKLRAALAEVADEVAGQRFGAFERTVQARSQIVGMFPEFSTKEGDLIRYLEVNPNLANEVAQLHNAGFPKQALQLAWREFERTLPPSMAGDAASLAAASLPNTVSAPPTQKPGVTEPNKDEQFMKALEYTHRTHDHNPALLALFGDSVPRGWPQK